MAQHSAKEIHEQIEFLLQLAPVSKELRDWASGQFESGRTVDHVKTQLRRVMQIAAPLRQARQTVEPNVSQFEHEFNLGWARENPELFVQSVTEFQTNTPTTRWRHYIDLSRDGFVKLIAVRRIMPLGTVN